MLEVIEGGLTTKPRRKRIMCVEGGCTKKASDSAGKCGIHGEEVTNETLRLLTSEQKLQLMSIPFNSWLPLYPNDLACHADWELLNGPIIFSRSILSYLEHIGLVAYESHLIYGNATTPVFSLTQRGKWVVEDLRTLGMNRSKCFQAVHGYAWGSTVDTQTLYLGAA